MRGTCSPVFCRRPTHWEMIPTAIVFTARRYASAVTAVNVLSVRHKPVLCQNDWKNRDGFWPPIPHCVIRKLGYLQKLEYFPLELSQTPDLKNFATASQSRYQQNSSSSWLFTTTLSTVTL